MIDYADAGMLMKLLFIIPFKSSEQSDNFGPHAATRILLLLCSFAHAVRCLIVFRGSPRSSLIRLALQSVLSSSLYTAVVTEIAQHDLDLEVYHNRFAYNFLVVFGLLLLIRQILAIFFVGVPGHFLAKISFLWRIWYQTRCNSDQAILEAHRKYGAIIRISPYEYSISDINYKGGLERLPAVNYSEPYIAGFSIVQRELQNSDVSYAIMGRTLKNEAIIDDCIKVLVNTLKENAVDDDKEGIRLSRLLTCFCWDVMSAITIGERFGFMDSTSAGIVADKLGHFKLQGILDGSYFRSYPWIRQILQSAKFMEKSNTDMSDLFQKILAERLCCETNRATAMEDDMEKLWDDIQNQSESLKTHVEAGKMGPQFDASNHLHAILSLLLAAADPMAVHLLTTLAYLACYPNGQRRIREEWLAFKKGKKNRYPLKALVFLPRDLPFLDAVLRESERLKYSNGFMRSHYSEPPIIIGNHRIPQGTSIRLSTHSYNRDISIFGVSGDDPDEWNPNRWLSETTPAGITFTRVTFPSDNELGRAIVAKIILHLINMFDFSTSMPLSGNAGVLSNSDIKELHILKRLVPNLYAKVIVNGKIVDALFHEESPTVKKVTSKFADGSKQLLLEVFLAPDKEKVAATFQGIESLPIDRKERGEIHRLIRHLSHGHLDSEVDPVTSRVKVFRKAESKADTKPASGPLSKPISKPDSKTTAPKSVGSNNTNHAASPPPRQHKPASKPTAPKSVGPKNGQTASRLSQQQKPGRSNQRPAPTTARRPMQPAASATALGLAAWGAFAAQEPQRIADEIAANAAGPQRATPETQVWTETWKPTRTGDGKEPGSRVRVGPHHKGTQGSLE